MKTISYEPKFNFHGQTALALRPTGVWVNEFARPAIGDAVHYYTVSPRTARKIERHFCGVAGCKCNSGGLIEIDHDRDGNGTLFGIPVRDAAMPSLGLLRLWRSKEARLRGESDRVITQATAQETKK